MRWDRAGQPAWASSRRRMAALMAVGAGPGPAVVHREGLQWVGGAGRGRRVQGGWPQALPGGCLGAAKKAIKYRGDNRELSEAGRVGGWAGGGMAAPAGQEGAGLAPGPLGGVWGLQKGNKYRGDNGELNEREGWQWAGAGSGLAPPHGGSRVQQRAEGLWGRSGVQKGTAEHK